MLTALDPAVAQGLDPRLLKLVLLEAELELERQARDPIVEAEVRSALGLAHAATGAFEEALEQFRRERALRITAGEPVDGAAIRGIDNAIGHALVESGELDAAREPLEQAARGADLVAANAIHNLAALARARGDIVRADELLRDALARKRALPDVPATSRLETEQELALVLAERGRYADAEPIARELARAKLALLGPRHPSTLRAANNLAEVLLALGQSSEARAILGDAIGPLAEILGPLHEDTLSARNNLAAAMLDLGDASAAVALYRENRDAFLERGGAADARTILASANLAQSLALHGAADDAEREFKAAADAALRALGPSSRITLANDVNYAAFLTERERWAEAVVVLERAAPLIERELGRAHPQCLAARTTLARARLGLGQAARAMEALEDVEIRSNPLQPLTRLERRSLEIALQAAQTAGDAERTRRISEALSRGP
jgi:tetratricopeptide (TPR) repeat protein